MLPTSNAPTAKGQQPAAQKHIEKEKLKFNKLKSKGYKLNAI
jgi:hypothetical protein